MRPWIAAVTAIVALWGVEASAGPPGVVHGPYVSFGFGYGYGHGYGYGPWGPGYGVYRPYPFWGPTFGIGVSVSRPQSSPPQQSGSQRGALKMYVYPAAGQSESRTAEDRYQCHVWAADQSGYDPTLGAGSRDDAEGYTRAFTACMEGRGYVVR